jgi:hypothetical protein
MPTSESILISDIKTYFFIPAGVEPKTLGFNEQAHYLSATVLICELCSVGYWILDKSLFLYRYNVTPRSLQSNIGMSFIKLSPILLITDIRLSAHLGLCERMWISTR